MNAELWVVLVGTTPNDKTQADAAGVWVYGPFANRHQANLWAEDVRKAFYEATKNPSATWPYGSWTVQVQQVQMPTDGYSATENWYEES